MTPEELERHIRRLKDSLTAVMDECRVIIEDGGLSYHDDLQMLVSFFAIAQDFKRDL